MLALHRQKLFQHGLETTVFAYLQSFKMRTILLSSPSIRLVLAGKLDSRAAMLALRRTNNTARTLVGYDACSAPNFQLERISIWPRDCCARSPPHVRAALKLVGRDTGSGSDIMLERVSIWQQDFASPDPMAWHRGYKFLISSSTSRSPLHHFHTPKWSVSQMLTSL